MASLFSQSGDSIRVLSPTAFHKTHVEDDLQRWADANPHLLNEGAPMLSLGMEIRTRHDHWIDNLFVDGNGCLVVAELKRGPTPKEVVAQVLNYAAYVSQLKWADVAEIGRKHRGLDLDAGFRECFGRPLVRSDKVDHRLLIVAETYDPSVTDAALYLINKGTPLALLKFTYFEVGDSRLFEVRTVLGEIPDQLGGDAEAATPDEGHSNWLFSSVAKELPEIARRQGWVVQHVINKQSLPFVSHRWPTKLDQCQLVLATWSRDKLSFRLKFRHDDLPGLRELLEERREEWRETFPAEFAAPPYPMVSTNLGYDVPMPEVGDTAMLTDIVERVERMAGAMVPLVTDYLARRQTGDT